MLTLVNGKKKRMLPKALSLVPFFQHFINDIVFINLDQSKLCNYADDSTIWIESTDKEDTSAKLEN